MPTSTRIKLIHCSALVSLFFLLSACTNQSPPSATLAPSPLATAQTGSKPQTVATPVATASADPLPKAEDKAISAANLARHAATVEDWDLVSSKLKQAIALIKTLPATSSKRTIAQKNLAIYQQQLQVAQQQRQTLAKNSTSPNARLLPQKTSATKVAVASLPALSGGSGLTAANYRRIEFGMSPDEVRSVLGTPTREEGNSPTFSLVWESSDKKTTVKIGFYQNKVTGKTCITSSSTMQCVSKA